MDNIVEGIKGELGYHHNNSQRFLSIMAEKYHKGTMLADLNVEEKKRLHEVSLNDIFSAGYPDAIRELKLESLREFMNSLEEDLSATDMFYPELSMIIKLNEIKYRGTEVMKADGTRVKKLLIKTVVNDIERKYDTDTPSTYLSGCEVYVLRGMRPLLDDILYPETVLALHWRIIEEGLDEDFEKMASDPKYEVENVPRVIRLSADKKVPEHIKTKAKELRKLNEDVIVERLPHKYNLNSNVDELTETEKAVLDRLNVIRYSYHPVVEYLHWQITHLILCKELRDFKAGNLKKDHYMPKKLEFLSTNDRVPDITKQLAKEFQEAMSRKKEEAWKKHTK